MIHRFVDRDVASIYLWQMISMNFMPSCFWNKAQFPYQQGIKRTIRSFFDPHKPCHLIHSLRSPIRDHQFWRLISSKETNSRITTPYLRDKVNDHQAMNGKSIKLGFRVRNKSPVTCITLHGISKEYARLNSQLASIPISPTTHLAFNVHDQFHHIRIWSRLKWNRPEKKMTGDFSWPKRTILLSPINWIISNMDIKLETWCSPENGSPSQKWMSLSNFTSTISLDIRATRKMLSLIKVRRACLARVRDYSITPALQKLDSHPLWPLRWSNQPPILLRYGAALLAEKYPTFSGGHGLYK